MGCQESNQIQVFLIEFLEKVDFVQKSADDKKSMQNYPEGKELM